MTNEQIKNHTRETIIADQIGKCEGVLTKKNKEYVQIKPKKKSKIMRKQLDYYKEVAGFMGITPKQALVGHMSKHTKSIFDMVQSDQEYSMEVWDEKITDHINYLLLLKIVTVEEAQENLPEESIDV